MAQVDFQELLNKEIVKKDIKEEKIKKFIEILEKRTDESMSKFLDTFFKGGKNEEKSQATLQDTIQQADDEDMLITEAVKQDTNEERVEISGESELEGAAEISDEELEEKYEESELSPVQKRVAYVYEKAMTEYYNLKINLEKQNIRDGSVCYDDRNFLKLMRLKEVAVKAEIWFKNLTGNYVGEAVESIGEMEKENERELAEYQRQNNKDHMASVSNISEIQQRIEECLKRIEQLNEMLEFSNDMQKENILMEIESLQEEYVELSERLEMLKPNALELAREEEKSKEQQDLDQDIAGYFGEMKNRKSESIDAKNYNISRQQEAIANDLDENGANSINKTIEEQRKETKESFEERIQDAIDRGDYSTAAILNQEYAETMTQDDNPNDDKEVINNAQKNADKIEQQAEEIEENSISQEAIVAGAAIGAISGITSNEYPPKADVGEKEISKETSKQVKDSSELAIEDVEKIDELEKIVNGEKAKEEAELSKDEYTI